MSATERDLLYRAKFQDDVTAGLTVVDSAIKETENSVKKTTAAIDPMANAIAEIKRREEAWKEEVFKLRDAVQKQTESFQLRAEALRDPATMRAVQEQQKLRQEIELLTRSTKTEEQEITALNTAMADNLIRLERQRNLVANPGYQAAMREEAKLKKEIADITKAALPTAEREAEVIGITTRQRRELIVAMREVMRGNFTQLSGTAMVLEEGKGGITGALKAAMEMMGGPYVVAAGGAALATAGVAAAMWKASEASAEMWHHMELLGKEEGVSAQTMLGFQYMATGTGVSVDQLGKAFATFTEKLGSHSAKMRELGITAQDPIQAFEQLMEIIKNTADATQRDAIAKETLGAGWKKLIPVLEQGKAGAEAAMAAMQIPPETAAAYERANKAQIEIDKAWVAIKASSGGYFAELRANLKEAEASLLGHSDKLELIRKKSEENYKIAVKEAALRGAPVPTGAQLGIIAGAAAAQRKESRQSENAALTDEQKEIAKSNLGILKKNDLSEALAEEKKQFDENKKIIMGDFADKRQLNQSHQKLLEDSERAHQMRMKEIRDQFARKGGSDRNLSERQATALEKYSEENREFSLGYGNAAEDQRRIAKIENTYREEEHSLKAHGALLVEMERAKNNEIQQIRDKALMQEFERQREDSQNQDKIIAERRQRLLEDKKLEVEAAQLRLDRSSIESPKPHNFFPGKDDHSASDKIARENLAQQRIDSVSRNIELEQAQNNQFKIDAIKEKYALRDMQRQDKLAQALFKEHEAKIEMIQKEADLVQGFSSRELSQAIQGKLTIKSLEADMTSFLADQFAERTTKWIEQSLLEKAFSEGQSAAQIAETQAQASLAASAWSPAAISASIATLGAASATGEAGYFQALASGQIAAASMIPHARGGMVFGTALKQPEETWTPVQPSRINPVSSSTTNHYGGPISITISGAGDPRAVAREVAKVLPRATMLAAKNRSGTSR